MLIRRDSCVRRHPDSDHWPVLRRNSEGHVIMYADKVTDSMAVAIEETNRRRRYSRSTNEDHGITPTTIKKAVRDLIAISKAVNADDKHFKKDPESMDEKELKKLSKELEKKMHQAAAELNFEEAARLRDRMIEIKKNAARHVIFCNSWNIVPKNVIFLLRIIKLYNRCHYFIIK